MIQGKLNTAYMHRCQFYGWSLDCNQQSAVKAFEDLYVQLASEKSFLSKFFTKKSSFPKGIYLHGSVGRGKTMLMDLFFSTVPLAQKIRLHFDAFMHRIHQQLNQEYNKAKQPIQSVAQHWGKTYKLICLDEFQVNDIADAMILQRLFEEITATGCGIVTTSNYAPDQLYRGGLLYERFQPFVKFLEKSFIVHHLDGNTDYRQQPHFGRRVYFTPHEASTEKICFDILGRHAHTSLQPLHLEINKRVLTLVASNSHVWATFEVLCKKPLGAADYQALADYATVVYLIDIPIFTSDMLNEARRFITLIDALYDQRIGLVATAEGLPNELNQTQSALPFERTISRLMEMQSETYVESALLRKK